MVCPKKWLAQFDPRLQQTRYLLLLTKSTNIAILRSAIPTDQVIVSFSVNSNAAATKYEIGSPDPVRRLQAVAELKQLGWRVRIRIDPIVLDDGIESYKIICGAEA